MKTWTLSLPYEELRNVNQAQYLAMLLQKALLKRLTRQFGNKNNVSLFLELLSFCIIPITKAPISCDVIYSFCPSISSIYDKSI